MKEKYTMGFVASDGRKIDMDLCCFCTRSDSLTRPVDCPHYENDFEDKSCVGFEKVKDVSLRIEALLSCTKSKQFALENNSKVMPNMR